MSTRYIEYDRTAGRQQRSEVEVDILMWRIVHPRLDAAGADAAGADRVDRGGVPLDGG